MLKWMCKHTRRHKNRNEVIQDNVGVTSIANKMRTTGMRWFGYVKRRCMEASIRRCESLAIVDSGRGRGRPKKN